MYLNIAFWMIVVLSVGLTLTWDVFKLYLEDGEIKVKRINFNMRCI